VILVDFQNDFPSALKEHEESYLKYVLLFAGIKGLYFNQPAHSCKDIRDSEDSKGDGEYWIDPERSGNPLKVYCDMTTDGGKLRIIINPDMKGQTF